MEDIFDYYRKSHLEPLTQFTIEIQRWLQDYGGQYYIAQRLKRRPQILRKLRRFSVRLTQLQDIGGCRIIVEKNSDVEALRLFLEKKIHNSELVKLVRETDYREEGRDESGYRALHLILNVTGRLIELQIRSRLQHYWSESIERTSVFYGKRLKEGEGDPKVIKYFKLFSNSLHMIERNLGLSKPSEIELQQLRTEAEEIINDTRGDMAMSGYVNTDVIKAMSERERTGSGEINNWILVFNWSDGNFITWEEVGRNVDAAIEAYNRYEREFTEEENFEVVLIGTSSIETVRNTHSHYFGIEHHIQALEDMEDSIIGLTHRSTLDVGARKILLALKKRRIWGKNTISLATLKNHYCQNIASFDSSLERLKEKGLIIGDGPISLDIRRKQEIDSFV